MTSVKSRPQLVHNLKYKPTTMTSLGYGMGNPEISRYPIQCRPWGGGVCGYFLE